MNPINVFRNMDSLETLFNCIPVYDPYEVPSKWFHKINIQLGTYTRVKSYKDICNVRVLQGDDIFLQMN
jgi:hypothetical protein